MSQPAPVLSQGEWLSWARGLANNHEFKIFQQKMDEELTSIQRQILSEETPDDEVPKLRTRFFAVKKFQGLVALTIETNSAKG
jgi:hypothetical protein